jgi:hypothetical protein
VNRISTIIWGVAVVLLFIWMAGMIARTTFGGLIHVLLILIIAAVVLDYSRRKGPSKPDQP